jgi:hypothetical protein
VRRGWLHAAGAVLAVAVLAGCGSGGGVPTYLTAYPPQAVGARPLPISLIDQTGLVISIAAAPDAPAAADAEAVQAVPGRAASLRVFWLGGECDDRVTMVLVSIGATYQLAIHNHPQITAGALCSAAGVPRIVDISFTRPLKPSDLSLTIQFP